MMLDEMKYDIEKREKEEKKAAQEENKFESGSIYDSEETKESPKLPEPALVNEFKRKTTLRKSTIHMKQRVLDFEPKIIGRKSEILTDVMLSNYIS